MAHFFLQLLVNPEAGKNRIIIFRPHIVVTVKAYDPRVGDVKPWSNKTDEVPML